MPNLIAQQAECNLTAEAVVQAKGGDASAFEYLYKAHCKRVCGMCLRMLRNPAGAEALTQQAFLQVFRKIGTFRGDSAFATWLHRMTVNIVLMHLRRKKTTELFAQPWDPADTNRGDSRELGSADASMLGAIDRLNLMRRSASCPLATDGSSCCTTSSDTSTTKSRGFWAVRRVVQNRSCTSPANGCGDCCWENKSEGNLAFLPPEAKRSAAPELDRIATGSSGSAFFSRISPGCKSSVIKFGAPVPPK